jgi:hypothetical protein
MAYRVTSHAAHRAPVGVFVRPPQRRGDPILTRNVMIAGASLACLALTSAGALLSGNEYGAAPSANSRALKVALIDPTAPAVVKRDPRVAIKTPVSSVAFRSEPPAPVRVAQITPEITPLPPARPAQQAIEAAMIPLPRARQAPVAALAYADPEPTGSLGEPAATPPVPAARRAVASIVAKPKRPLTIQEKLWGGPVRLASLTPDAELRDMMPGSGLAPGVPHAPFDKQTAVYVISEKKVYLPDGSVLEAHSGLGEAMDNPRFVSVRMRGATPPHVYDITMREGLFHGVEALRMTPIGGEESIFGRAGILAHPYMLGPNGQSNGCVSFKDYDAFLDAFKDGKVNRMAVLARLD